MFIVCVAAWLTGCGDSHKTVVQPQISSFAFMQDAGGYLFTPMLGKYTTTGATTVFTTSAVLDSSTNQPVTGEFYSIALSPDGSRAIVDLYGGQNGDSGQWDIFIADSGDRGNMMAVTNDAYLDALPQFSPDATKVIFNSERPGPKDSKQWQIVTRRTDGSGELVLPMPLGADQTWAPTYSPDGSRIAVEAWGYDSLGRAISGSAIFPLPR
jgi:Tol biopolymer transport system component